VVGESGQCCIESYSPNGGCESGTDTSDTDLDWDGVVDVGKGDGKEIEDLWWLGLDLEARYRRDLRRRSSCLLQKQ
jgi:hypothetical protein